MAGPKDRQVVALRNLENDWLLAALGGKIFREFLPQETRMCAHDAVFARVIARDPVEDVDPDLLLGGRFGRVLNRAIGDVTQELP
jgi:hypothetical protein